MAGPTTPNKDAKQQRREAAAQAKREQERQRRAAQRRRSLAIYVGIIVAVLVIGGLIARSALRPGPGEAVADQGQIHIVFGQPHPSYNSNPPTSGWHTGDQVAPWGATRTEIPDEIVVHNLEHGGIWISYKDPKDTALVEKLEALASRYRSKVIVTPRPKNDAPIAVAAWDRLLKLSAYDEKRIVEFIDVYKNKGPERVPD